MEKGLKKYNDKVANTRRPLVLIVGKPLSQEELKPVSDSWD